MWTHRGPEGTVPSGRGAEAGTDPTPAILTQAAPGAGHVSVREGEASRGTRGEGAQDSRRAGATAETIRRAPQRPLPETPTEKPHVETPWRTATDTSDRDPCQE